MKKSLTQTKLIIFTAIFFTIFYNNSFYKSVIVTYPLNGVNIIYIVSLTIFLTSFLIFLFTPFSSRYTTKPILITTLLISSFTAYFMDTYHVVIDSNMIHNILQTNLQESSDLLSLELVLYVLCLGILPSILIYKIKINYRPLGEEIFSKTKTILLAISIILIILFSFSKFYTSFFREHKPLRLFTNPTFWIYSTGKYINKRLDNKEVVVKPIATDAKILRFKSDKSRLVILVVGEAVRADHFSLNGYKRDTNKLVKNEDIINFSNFTSCGTSTAHSVPCMFSLLDKDAYSYKKGLSQENILDVLDHTKEISILWRDNNSNSKYITKDIPYKRYTNSDCQKSECRDENMIKGLEKYIQEQANHDIFIVLHQMGNHGPSYYKRYPKEFEKFTPICKTNQLEKCSKEEILNAYDNALLYTDYFLSKVINLLKNYNNSHKTAMIYMSDHGESLGENGIYLHGLPYFMAPDTQTHIGAFIWFGDNFKNNISIKKLKKQSNKHYSHDNLFHTLLGIFNVKTEVYNQHLDILKGAKNGTKENNPINKFADR